MDFHASIPRAVSHASFEYNTIRVEVVHTLDRVADITESHALASVNFQHSEENGIDFRGDWEDGREEVVGTS